MEATTVKLVSLQQKLGKASLCYFENSVNHAAVKYNKAKCIIKQSLLPMSVKQVLIQRNVMLTNMFSF